VHALLHLRAANKPSGTDGLVKYTAERLADAALPNIERCVHELSISEI